MVGLPGAGARGKFCRQRSSPFVSAAVWMRTRCSSEPSLGVGTSSSVKITFLDAGSGWRRAFIVLGIVLVAIVWEKRLTFERLDNRGLRFGRRCLKE